MYTLFSKFLCATALASTALVHSISIISPKPGTTFTAGQQITVELKESPAPSWDTLDEVALVIGTFGGSFDNTHLGTIGFQGVFAGQWKDNEGNQYANYSITAPNSFNGPASINVAHFYLLKPDGTSNFEYASVAFTVIESIG